MKTPEEEYQQSYAKLTTPEEGRDPVMVHAIPTEIKRLKEEDLDAKGFVRFIMQDEGRKETFLSDKYFTANLMKELNKEEASEVIDDIKENILERESPSEYEYVFDSSFFVKKTTQEELQKKFPIAYPNLPDEAVDAIAKAQENGTFVTLIFGDTETGQSWGEINDIKGVIGVTGGREWEPKASGWKNPFLISFKGQEDDVNYDELHTKKNSDIKKYLKDRNIELDDVISSRGGIISENIVAIKTGFGNGIVGVITYEHDNFTPKYDIENAEVERLEFEEKTTKRNTRTGEETSTTRTIEQFQLSAEDSKTRKMEVIFRCENFEDIEAELAFQYELALKNPANANAEKKLEISEKMKNDEAGESDAPRRKRKNKIKR